MTSAAGLPYRLLVPATLLDAGAGTGPVRRTVRDWFVDIWVFVLPAAAAPVLYASTLHDSTGGVPTALQVIDIVLGVISCLSLWWRRRFPVSVGALTCACSLLSISAGIASLAALFTVAVHRRTGVAVAMAAANAATATVFVVIRPQTLGLLPSTIINVAVAGVCLAWGMLVRSRRQLVISLRDRAERAEAEQRILAEQARLAERTRIAREMHDVLAHRISLMALHAGGLQVRPDVGEDQVRETATLLRATAKQVLEELRGVIGVLRDDQAPADAPSAPLPALRDLPRLIADSRRAGARIEFTTELPADVEAPAALGRDAYRVVQEALTNVAKHAGGTATTVRVTGAPGDGLHVEVRNRLPLVVGSVLPGSGTGLLGLAERVGLAGGTLQHGPNQRGEFVVDAWLTW